MAETTSTRNVGPRRSGNGNPFGGGPGPQEKPKSFGKSLRRLLGYLYPFRIRMSMMILTALLSTIFNIVSPKILGLITTELFEGLQRQGSSVSGTGIDFGAIGRIVYLLVWLYCLSALFGYLEYVIAAILSQRAMFNLRQEVNAKIARLPLSYFDTHTHGEIMSRVTNDIDTIAVTLQQSLTQIVTAVITLLGVVAMMLSINPALTLIAMATLPFLVALTGMAARRSQRYFGLQQAVLGRLNGHVEEMYTGHLVVKAFGYERESLAEFDALNQALYQTGWKAQFVSGLIMPFVNLVNNVGYVLVSVAGGLFVAGRIISIGDVQAFIQYSRQFGEPLSQSANIANMLQSTLAAAERVFELLDEREEREELREYQILESPRGEVVFDRVYFSYQPDRPLISDFNIRIEPGQTVAIVGPTGAGKTTLVNLLLRFYELDDGAIRIDGLDIRDMRRETLRSLFGMVLQETWLFHGTIRANIAYGREGADDEAVIRAAEATRADHFIRALPEGYQTILDEDGANLSQGQKQLLTIARTLLADPAILILDEATSNVDTRTEALIQQALSRLMAGRTSFVIAHRLSTIRDADLILVMDQGRIIEMGKHHQLLAERGFYADLYRSQFQSSVHGEGSPD